MAIPPCSTSLEVLLSSPAPLLLDGAMGTMLQRYGPPPGIPLDTLNLTHPQWVLEVHRSYREAGAQLLYTNTFGAGSLGLTQTGPTPEEVVRAGVALARQAAGAGTAPRPLVAAALGPLAQRMAPHGPLSPAQVRRLYARQATAADRAGADLVVLETMMDLEEARTAVEAVRENTPLPVICTMTFGRDGRSLTGDTVGQMARVLEPLGVAALGFNCCHGPDSLLPLVAELARHTALPMVAKPSAGLPDPHTLAYPLGPRDWGLATAALAGAGARLLGGCCGTTPDAIACLGAALDGRSL